MNDDIAEVQALHDGLSLRFIQLLNNWRSAYGRLIPEGTTRRKDRQVAITHNWRPSRWSNV